MAHPQQIVEMAMQKLGQQKKSIELAVPNVELAWKIDDVFMERANAYARLMFENKQIRQVPDLNRPSPAVPCNRMGGDRLSEQVTALPETQRSSAAPDAPVAAANAGGVRRDCAPSRSARLSRCCSCCCGISPSPIPARGSSRARAKSRVMMYDFSFGGIYDDAFSGTILTHIWKSMTRVYGGFFLAAVDRDSARPDDRPASRSSASCSIRPSTCCGRSR